MSNETNKFDDCPDTLRCLACAAETPTPSLSLRGTPANDPSLDMNDLVRRAAEGDRRAIGAVAIAFGPILYDIACRETDCGQDAEDVVQDFFLYLVEGRGALFPPGRRRGLAWLGGLVRAMARSRRRDQKGGP